MKRSKLQWGLTLLLLVLTLALAVASVMGFNARTNPETTDNMLRMRNYTVLRSASGALVDEVAAQAKKDARAFAKTAGYSRNQTNIYVGEQETLARAEADAKYKEFASLDIDELDTAILNLENTLASYYDLETQEKALYAEAWRAEQKLKGEEPAAEEGAALSAEGEGISEEALLTQEVEVDYSGFVPSAQLAALKEQTEPVYDNLFLVMQKAVPELRDDMKEKIQPKVMENTTGADRSFAAAFDRYQSVNALSILDKNQQTTMGIARNADNLVLLAIGALVMTLTMFFYGPLKKKLGMPRLIISLFFIMLLLMCGLYNISISGMISTVLWRTGMYGVLALAMLPGIQSGISLNMGMTVGIISGLLSTLLALQMNMTGWLAFAFSVVVGILLALPVGLLYGKLLNRLKGSEMTISTYVGFSYVSLFCIAWMLLPFNNPRLTWALGKGMRTMHNMKNSFGQILDNTLSFNLFGVHVPTGLLLFFLLCCLIMWLFSRSKTGTAMIAAGANPRFAEAAGINVNKMRITGTTISTIIAAVGIIVYSQSFGFMQLYNGPKQMGFVAASAILIGGASTTRAKVSHVIIGTFLFQGVLALGIQVANALISEGGLSEVMRILISNGIILYALTQTGGDSRD